MSQSLPNHHFFKIDSLKDLCIIKCKQQGCLKGERTLYAGKRSYHGRISQGRLCRDCILAEVLAKAVSPMKVHLQSPTPLLNSLLCPVPPPFNVLLKWIHYALSLSVIPQNTMIGAHDPVHHLQYPNAYLCLHEIGADAWANILHKTSSHIYWKDSFQITLT